MNLKEILDKTLREVYEVVKEYRLLREEVTEKEINDFIDEQIKRVEEGYYVEPLDMIYQFTRLPSVSIIEYDDCNIYQESGYFKDTLEGITQTSEGTVIFSDIEEIDRDDGKVELLFTYNGQRRHLTLDIFEEHDTVPREFTETLNNIIRKVSGDKIFLNMANEYGNYYVLVTKDLGDTLNKITREFFAFIRQKGVTFHF